jgi:predicted glycosyltransferase
MAGDAMNETTRPRPRVLFYVQHLLGIGHLARASRIANALADDDFEVTVVTGGMPVSGFPGPRVRHVALPPITAGDAGETRVRQDFDHHVSIRQLKTFFETEWQATR